jgi:transposase
MRVKPSYTDEFKSDALDLLDRTGRSLPDVARDLGVCVTSLRSWYKLREMTKKRKRTGVKPTRSASPEPEAESAEGTVKRMERENAALKRENESLKMDREILKKAAAFFAKESE